MKAKIFLLISFVVVVNSSVAFATSSSPFCSLHLRRTFVNAFYRSAAAPSFLGAASDRFSVTTHVVDGVRYPTVVIFNDAQGLRYLDLTPMLHPALKPAGLSELETQLHEAAAAFLEKVPNLQAMDQRIELSPVYYFDPLAEVIQSLYLFPSVYPYNNPYTEALLTEVFPRVLPVHKVLVLGTGAGIEAVALSRLLNVSVDAVDINPFAVANTQVNAMRAGTEHLVKAWTSDGLNSVAGRYDVILFTAPLPEAGAELEGDVNRADVGGALLRRVLAGTQAHLKPNGRMFLMSQRNISKYVPKNLSSHAVKRFTALSVPLAIHEIQVKIPVRERMKRLFR